MDVRLEEQIRQIVISKIAELKRPDLFREPLTGYSRADDPRYEELKHWVGEWVKTPRELFPSAVSEISIFVPFTGTTARSPRYRTHGTPEWGEAYVVINDCFDLIGKALQQHLERAGYKSYLIAATHTYNEADMKSMWSHRSAAVAAGLGEFGANRMVITPKGSAGRFCSVITEAPLEPTHSDGVERCGYLRNGSCGLCFKVCPVGALQPGSINRKACQAETRKNEKLLAEREGILGADTCGRCISVCPAAYIE